MAASRASGTRTVRSPTDACLAGRDLVALPSSPADLHQALPAGALPAAGQVQVEQPGAYGRLVDQGAGGDLGLDAPRAESGPGA